MTRDGTAAEAIFVELVQIGEQLGPIGEAATRVAFGEGSKTSQIAAVSVDGIGLQTLLHAAKIEVRLPGYGDRGVEWH